MSSLADAIVVGDSSDDEGPKPPPAVPARARAKAKAPPPPPSARAKAQQCLPPARKKLCDPDRQAVAVASLPSPPPVISTTERCTVSKCTAGSCLRLHQCEGRGGGKGRACQGLWLAGEAFNYKKGGEKRNLTCKECAAKNKEKNAITNPIYSPINNAINGPINNAKTAAKKMQERIAYEKATLGDEHDVSPKALQAHREAAIDHVTQLIADNWKIYPKGFAVQIYGASTGSQGFSVKEEGVNQLRQRGYKSATIIDATGYAPPVALTRAWGPGGKSVYDCGSSKVISRTVETALHKHFWPICDASDGKMLRLWRACGAGAPQGIGPYHVCIRIMPLPMPHGWRRGF